MVKKRIKKTTPQFDEVQFRAVLRQIGEDKIMKRDEIHMVLISLMNMDHPGEFLARMGVYDLDPCVASGALCLTHIILDGSSLFPDLVDDLLEEAGPILRKGLESPNIPDMRKVELVRLCEKAGYFSPQDDPSRFFNDWPGAMKQSMESHLELFQGEPGEVIQLLDMICNAPEAEDSEDAAFRIVMEMAKYLMTKNPVAASRLLASGFVMGFDDMIEEEDLELALNLLGAQDEPESVWWLKAIAGWPGLEEWHDRAQRIVTKKQLSGIKPGNSFDRTFSEAIVTLRDGAGARQLFLTFHNPKGKKDALFFLLKLDEGISDLFVVPDEGDRLDKILHEMGQDPMSYATCTLEQALSVLADAFAIQLEEYETLPPGLFSLLPYFPDGLPDPMRRTVSLDGYDVAGVARNPEMVSESASLLAGSVYLFQFTAEDTYEYLSDHKPRNKRKLTKKWQNEYLAALEKVEKPLLIDRLENLLEIEAWAGRAQLPYTQTLLQTWVALKEDIVPFNQIPLVQTLAAISVPMVVENLAMGFFSQKDANNYHSAMAPEFSP